MPLGYREVVDHQLFPAEPFRWRMGVRTAVADQWLQSDDARPDDLAEKARLTRRHPASTFVALPGSASAAGEVATLVAEELALHGEALGPRRRHPLETAALSVQEDLCLLEPADGAWVLTAGSVCFPTRWDLPSKLGRTLGAIHEPVPGYDEHLGARVDRFFDRMVPGALAYRLNWSLVGSSARCLEVGGPQAPDRLPDDPGTELFVRVERQTLRRLVDHSAIVFGIRIHVWSLGEVMADLSAEGLACQLESLPGEVAAYKDVGGFHTSLATWLRYQ